MTADEPTGRPVRWLHRAFQDGVQRLLGGPEPAADALELATDRLDRLQKLRELEDGLRRSRAWWWLTVLVGCAALPPIVMALWRVGHVEVEAEVRIAELTFVAREALPIETDVPLVAFAADGIGRIDSPALPDIPRDSRSLRVQATRGAMTLQRVTVPAGAQVRVTALPARALTLHVACQGCRRGSVVLAARGTLHAEADRRFRLVVPQASPITLRFDTTGFDITLLPADTAEAVPLFGLVEVDSLAFLQTITVVSGTAADDTTVSSVRSGSYRLPVLGGEPVPVRRFEVFDIGPAAVRLHDLQASGGLLEATLHATTARLRTGIAGHTRNRKPTWLRWATTRQELTLLYSTLVGVVALVLGLARWFQR